MIRPAGLAQITVVLFTISAMLGAVKALGAVPWLATVAVLLVVLLYRVLRRLVERRYGLKPRPDGWLDPLERPIDALIDQAPRLLPAPTPRQLPDEVRR